MKNPVNKFLAIAAAFLLLANIGMLFFMLKGKDRSRNINNNNRRGQPMEMIAKELGLTEEQKTTYKKMREEHFDAIRPLFDSINSVRSTFFSLIKNAEAGDSALNNYSGKIAGLQSAIDKKTVTHFRSVRTMFSGDQLSRYDAFVQKLLQRIHYKQGGGRWKKDSLEKKE
jgi:Spy/CpxP family protein refolding chaperone